MCKANKQCPHHQGCQAIGNFLWDAVTGVGHIAGLVQEMDGNLNCNYMNDQPHAQSLPGLAMNHNLSDTTTCNTSTALKIE